MDEIEIEAKRDEDGKLAVQVRDKHPPATDEEIFICKGKVAESRLRIRIMFPYLSQIILAMGQRYSDKIERAGVDKYGRLYLYAPWMNSLTDSERDAIIMHEAMHLLLMHTERAAAINAEHEMYNYAGDFAINSILRANGVSMPEGALLPELAGFPDLRSTEEYYALLEEMVEKNKDGDGKGNKKGKGMQDRMEGQSNSNERGDPNGDDGSGAGGREGQWEEEGMADALSPAEQQELRQVTAQAMREYSKSRGSAPGGWERWIDDILGPPKVRWDKRLFRVVAAALTEVKGRTHINWKRPGRRQIPGFMLPAKHSIIPQMGLFVDNSGSMGDVNPDHPLGKALREAQGVIEQMNLPSVWYGAVDATPNFEMVQTRNILKEKLVGGGGTDMRLAWQRAEEMGLHILILFTDGYTPWPETDPGIHSIVVITSGDESTGVPDWCHQIIVKD